VATNAASGAGDRGNEIVKIVGELGEGMYKMIKPAEFLVVGAAGDKGTADDEHADPFSQAIVKILGNGLMNAIYVLLIQIYGLMIKNDEELKGLEIMGDETKAKLIVKGHAADIELIGVKHGGYVLNNDPFHADKGGGIPEFVDKGA
jgi:hypothetical protein